MTVAELRELLARVDDQERPVLVTVVDRIDGIHDDFEPTRIFDLPDDDADTVFIDARELSS